VGIIATFRGLLASSSLLNFFKSSLGTKVPIIEDLINRFPKRKFILVGDSGEHDPEVYGVIGRDFIDRELPDHLLHIFIRDVTPDSDKIERFKKAFKGIPENKWTVFNDAAVLKNLKNK
jgi:phosphatidate phosphatase APP1